MVKSIIIYQCISDPVIVETWGSLKELCGMHPQLNYNSLRNKKLPIDIDGYRIIKTSHKELSSMGGSIV